MTTDALSPSNSACKRNLSSSYAQVLSVQVLPVAELWAQMLCSTLALAKQVLSMPALSVQGSTMQAFSLQGLSAQGLSGMVSARTPSRPPYNTPKPGLRTQYPPQCTNRLGGRCLGCSSWWCTALTL